MVGGQQTREFVGECFFRLFCKDLLPAASAL